MEERKILTPSELLAARKWTDFLHSLSTGTTAWRITDYRDFISLRTTASILTGKEKPERTYSIIQDKDDKTVFRITIEKQSCDGTGLVGTD